MKSYSKELSYILRHNPEGLDVDEYGWVSIEKLLNKIKGLTREELEKEVKNNGKKRFSINEENDTIRAAQGHSFPIKFDNPKVPPEILYHGTTFSKFQNIIKQDGLKKMKRHHVHMSNDKFTALDVGKRYAKDINNVKVISIDSKRMYKDGIDFFESDNGVWLTDYVDPKYFIN